MIQKIETLIVGAGVIGSSVAMHLSKMGMRDIRVIDFDLEGSLSSSELNAGGVRATWVHPLNIEMSIASIRYFASVAEEVGYSPCGYLWLHLPGRFELALKAREKQLEKGWPIEVLDVPQLRRKLPFIDKTDDLAGAIFAPRDGLINPNLLKNHYRAMSKENGVIYEDRTLLREVRYPTAGGPIQIEAERFENVLSHETKIEVLTATHQPFGRSRVEYQAQRIINCAGPWAAQVASLLGYKSPSFPVRRQVSIFDCRDVDLTPYGMIVDPSGVYFHPEATHGLAGFATPGEPRGFNYSYDGEEFFTESIWPALYERSTAFERLKHLSGWAGLYDVSPDEGAIIGPVTLRGQGSGGIAGRLYEAHSFSGHGVMHSYSAGLALAEIVIQGKYGALDVSGLASSRFETGKLIRESLII